MDLKKYTINQRSRELELIVPSRKITLGKFALLFQACIYVFLIVVPVLMIFHDPKIDVLILGALLVIVSTYLLRNCYDAYRWLSNGREVLNIDLNKSQLVYKKIGRKVFQVVQADLASFKGFKWCPENDELLDDPSRYGMQGGRICFWIEEERYRMGISLTKEEAQNCIAELNDFLMNSRG